MVSSDLQWVEKRFDRLESQKRSLQRLGFRKVEFNKIESIFSQDQISMFWSVYHFRPWSQDRESNYFRYFDQFAIFDLDLKIATLNTFDLVKMRLSIYWKFLYNFRPCEKREFRSYDQIPSAIVASHRCIRHFFSSSIYSLSPFSRKKLI